MAFAVAAVFYFPISAQNYSVIEDADCLVKTLLTYKLVADLEDHHHFARFFFADDGEFSNEDETDEIATKVIVLVGEFDEHPVARAFAIDGRYLNPRIITKKWPTITLSHGTDNDQVLNINLEKIISSL